MDIGKGKYVIISCYISERQLLVDFFFTKNTKLQTKHNKKKKICNLDICLIISYAIINNKHEEVTKQILIILWIIKSDRGSL